MVNGTMSHTLTISELIALLEERRATHGERYVEVEYEGVTCGIGPETVYLAKDGVLYIDIDAEMYKKEFAVDVCEGGNV